MKKFDFRKIRIKKVNIHEIEDNMLLINLYATQIVTLVIAFVILLFQKRNLFSLLSFLDVSWRDVLLYGAGFALAVIAADLLVSRFVPDEVLDDGGVNERIFKDRSYAHIAVISLVVAICEELLFRGAVQHAFGPYWTSILFAAIHVRYLQHWLMTGIVFASSYGLGWIYDATGTIWTPILAHFLIDFVMGCMIRFMGRRTT